MTGLCLRHLNFNRSAMRSTSSALDIPVVEYEKTMNKTSWKDADEVDSTYEGVDGRNSWEKSDVAANHTIATAIKYARIIRFE